jgi:hypothetical protein
MIERGGATVPRDVLADLGIDPAEFSGLDMAALEDSPAAVEDPASGAEVEEDSAADDTAADDEADGAEEAADDESVEPAGAEAGSVRDEAAIRETVKSELEAEFRSNVSALQSKLDRRYRDLAREKADAEGVLNDERATLEAAIEALAEYDEDAAKALRSKRDLAVTDGKAARGRAAVALDERSRQRDAWYDRYESNPDNPRVDRHDPELLDHFHSGNQPAYESRFALLQERARTRQADPANAPTKAIERDLRVRADKTQVAQKARETAEREKARGPQPGARRSASAAPAKAKTADEAEANFIKHARAVEKQLGNFF